MSERNSNCKRELEEVTSTPPLKKTKLDDSASDDSHDVVFAASSECSVTSAGKESDQRTSVISGCCNSESREIANSRWTPVVDLEAHQISETETEISTFITSNFRKETSPVREGLEETTTTEMESSSATERKDDGNKPTQVGKKTPTPAEIEEFLSELEKEDDNKQKQFVEKYNFDIVNDEPLQGRYQWVRVELP